MKSTLKLIPLVIILLMMFSCREDSEEIILKALYTEKDVQKNVVQTVSTNIATGFNSLFSEWYTDSTSRDVFSRDFTHHARFFSDGNGYVFIETFSGYNIAYPPDTTREGTLTINQTDANGKKIVVEMINIAEYIGYGFLGYDYLNPFSQSIERKTTFVKKIPDYKWYAGSGFYNNNSGQLYSDEEMNREILNQSVDYMADGIGAVLPKHTTDSMQGVELMRALLKHIRFFEDQSGYFFVIDFKGYNVVQPPDPSIQGTYEWDIQDSRGNYLVRGLVETAQNGGGYYSYYWKEYESGQEKLKTAYVKQIPGKEYLIGSGIYN